MLAPQMDLELGHFEVHIRRLFAKHSLSIAIEYVG